MKPWIATTLGLAISLLAVPSLRAAEPVLTIDAGGHKSLIKTVVFSRDGRLLVSAGDDKDIRVWNVETGEPVRTIRGQTGPGREGQITLLALSPDERFLAAAGFLPGTPAERYALRLHDFQTGRIIRLLQRHTDDVLSLAFSPDSRFLASSGADGILNLWDVTEQRVYWTETKLGLISSLSFSSDGTRLLTGGGTTGLWLRDANTGSPIRRLENPEPGSRLAVLSPDGRFAAAEKVLVGGRGNVVLWDTQTGGTIADLGMVADLAALSFSPDGQQLIAIGGGTSSALRTFSIPARKLLDWGPLCEAPARTAAISPDGKTAATSGTREICLSPLGPERTTRRLTGKGAPVWSVGWSADGRSIAFGNTFRYTGANHRGPLERLFLLGRPGEPEIDLGGKVTDESSYTRALETFGDYGLRTKSGEMDPVLQIFQKDRLLREIKRDTSSGTAHRCFTFTPDGRFVISGSISGLITVYSRDTGKKVRDLIGHTGEVWAVAVSPDGRRLVSGSEDQTFRLWDLESGKQSLAVFAGSDAEWVAWVPEGYYTSSIQGDRYVGWRLDRGVGNATDYYPAAQFQQQFYQPEVVARYLQTPDLQQALTIPAPQRPTPEQKVRPPHEAMPFLVETATSLETILPPILYVIEPTGESITVRQETVRIRAAAFSNTLPLTDLKVLINGLQIYGQPEGTAKGDPLRREVEMDVTLKPGENVLTFVAAHEKARTAPEIRRIRYEPAPGTRPETAKPDLILLAIGISDYSAGSLALSFADDDARTLTEAFRGQEKRLFGRVVTRVLPEPGKPARRGDILKALDWLSREGGEQDLRILFLSGHGGLDRRGNYYFFAQDRDPAEDPEIDSVRWDRVLESLTSVPSNTILMIDSCHAGAAGPPGVKSSADLTRVVKEMSSLYSGLVTFAASTGWEVSVERKEWGHGAFTLALLEGLRGKADGFGGGDRNGRIDTEELGAWIKKRVRELTDDRQHAIFDSGGVPPFDLFAPK